jgi:hypothetical protein
MNVRKEQVKIAFLILGFCLSILGGSCGTSQNNQANAASASAEQAIPSNFTFSVLAGNPLNTLTVTGSIAPGIQPVTATFIQFSGAQQNFVNGTFNQGDQSWTLDSTSKFPVLMSLPNASPSRSFTLSISVVSPVLITPDLKPANGALEFTDDAGNIIRVTFFSPSVGVAISLNSQTSVNFSLTDFQNLLGSGAPIWQQEAYLALVALEFIVFPMKTVNEIIQDILTNESTLTAKLTLPILCDSLSNSNPVVTAPSTVQNQGLETLTFSDVNGNGTIDTGDSFTVNFIDCFNQNMEVIIQSGFLRLFLFVREITNNAITRIGFEPSSTETGGILFSNTDIWLPTDTTGGITINGNPKMNVNGGFSLVFFQ